MWLILVWGHYLADFVLQTRKMALEKSKYISTLFLHCLEHFLVYLILCTPFVGGVLAFKFAGVNAILHGVVDWNIWRGYKYIHRDKDITTFRYWETHGFWSVVGLDQAIHYTCLVLTAWWLLCE